MSTGITELLAEAFDPVCSWCPLCQWKDFPEQVAPGFLCPSCDAPALPPPDATEPVWPLLLEEGTKPLWLQVLDARFVGRYGEIPNFNPLFACRIETAGIREIISPWLRKHPRLGCIAVNNAPLSYIMKGDDYDWTSYVLFAPQWFYAKNAWSVARRLAKASPGNAAIISAEDYLGCYLVLADKHAVILDGEMVNR